MDYKTAYSQSVKIAKEIAEEEDELQRKISSGVHRKEVFGANWQNVNINEIVERLTPNAKTVRLSGKIYYNGDDGHYAIIADIGGGYLRITTGIDGHIYPLMSRCCRSLQKLISIGQQY